jgi:hypothetical protein
MVQATGQREHRHREITDLGGTAMTNNAAISLTTGLEDPECVTVALLVAVGAAESGRPTLVFLDGATTFSY